MKKAGADPKVKKTFVRNCENIVDNEKILNNVDARLSKSSTVHFTQPVNYELDKPTLCSSEILANYISDTKNTLPSALDLENVKLDHNQLGNKVTKKLNFHLNDRIYKNLVELNADVVNVKTNKKEKKVKTVVKKDLEPNLEDFCQDEKEEDLRPHIPVIEPALKPVKKIESDSLHRLVASFEIL